MDAAWDYGDAALYIGDCVEVMREMPDASVDAVCTDPPYGLEFMGKEWDSFKPARSQLRTRADQRTNPAEGSSVVTVPEAYVAGQPFQAWCKQWAAECYRVLKPGGHLLAFGGTRTYHRMTCGIEDAGFEIRDSIHWVYGTGFPKSLDVSKAIDKAAGAQREVIGPHPSPAGNKPGGSSLMMPVAGMPETADITRPATDDARQWDGWGTALKPAHEPIVVARKPLTGTVAANVLEHGTGALNIDGCRTGDGGGTRRGPEDIVHGAANRILGAGLDMGNSAPRVHGLGRWPANFLLCHSADCEEAGPRKVKGKAPGPMRRGATTGRSIGGDSAYGSAGPHESVVGYGDEDGLETVTAYRCAPGCPVAEMDRQSGVTRSTGGHGTASREAALAGDVYGDYSGTTLGAHAGGLGDKGGASRFFPVFRYDAKARTAERPRGDDGTSHPTVKPVSLMAWLVRLVTARGGTVLDLFGGSGTTAEACIIEGMRCILIEKDPASADLIRVRLGKPIQPGLF